MAISMYPISVPVLIKSLNSISAILGKAAAHVEAKKLEPRALLDARLFPDMFTLTRQVQIACDMAKAAGARLAGIDLPSFEDNEASFADLEARIAKTVAFLQTLREEQFEGAEDRDITIPTSQITFQFKGLPYLLSWVFPNLYFHITTAYAILRHNGVELGKVDYLGPITTA
jgi:uncharacterized protein